MLGCVRLDVYGSTCDKLCTDNCPESGCNISNGACYSCAPGWTGDFCQKGKKKAQKTKTKQNNKEKKPKLKQETRGPHR